MATGSRTLKLSILADVDQLKKSLAQGEKDTQSFGDKMTNVGAKVGAAFALAAAAAAAYAVKIGIDGVKSAIEDEAAQVRLAGALRTATGATDAQIKATEDYITKTQLATGITDNDLRASFQRLSVSTKDVTKSQDLLNLAIDISKGTGKDLASVTEALAKSYEGTDGKLAKLGIGLSAADLKTMNFTETTKALSNLYGGAAAANAETFQGRIDRLKQAFDEGKEAIGARLLPIIEKLIGYLFQYGIPIFNKFKDAWDVIADAIDKNKEKFAGFIDLMTTYVLPILKTVFGYLIDIGAKVAAAIISAFGTIAGAITPTLNFIIDGINAVIRGLNLVKIGNDIGYVNKIGSAPGSPTRPQGESFTTNGAITTPNIIVPSPSGSGGSSTVKTPSAPAIDYSINPTLPNGMLDLTAPQNAASARAQAQADAYFKANPNIDPMTGATININIGVAGDPEATARVIVDTINGSYYRGTGGADRFVLAAQ
jgi:hypothetical protein